MPSPRAQPWGPQAALPCGCRDAEFLGIFLVKHLSDHFTLVRKMISNILGLMNKLCGVDFNNYIFKMLT